MDLDWNVSDDAVGLLLLILTAALVLLGWSLALVGLRKLRQEAERANDAAETLEVVAASAAPEDVKRAALAAQDAAKDISAALAEMKGPLAPARVMLALAVLVFVVAVAAFGIVDLSVTTEPTDTTDTTPTETEQTETETTPTTR